MASILAFLLFAYVDNDVKNSTFSIIGYNSAATEHQPEYTKPL